MPSALKFTIGGDASPFAKVMDQVAKLSSNSGSATANAIKKNINELEKLVAQGGEGTKFYASALKFLVSELNKVEVATLRATQATDKLTEARARVALGRGRAGDRRLIAAADADKVRLETTLALAQPPISSGIPSSSLDPRIQNRVDDAAWQARLKSFRDKRNAMQWDMVTRKTGNEANLARLRAMMQAGGAQEAAARKEIRALAEARKGRAGGSQSAHGGISVGWAQLIHTGRATVDSIASGANPFTVMMQQAPQMFQAMMGMGGTLFEKFAKLATTPFAGAGNKAGGAFLSGLRTSLAAMPLAVGGIVAASLAAILGSFFLFFKRVDMLVNRLGGLKPPDLDRTYIASINQAAEAWRKVAEATREAVKEYKAAAATSQRNLALINESYEAQRNFLELAKQRELLAAGSRSPARQMAIEHDYAQKMLQLEEDRRAAALANKQQEAAATAKEADLARQNAANMTVGDKAKYDKLKTELATRAAAAQKLLDEQQAHEEERHSGAWGGRGTRTGDALKRFFATGLSAESRAAWDAQPGTDAEKARQWIKDNQKFLDADAAKQRQFAKRDKLSEEAATKTAKAATLQLEIETDRRNNLRAATIARGLAAGDELNRLTSAARQAQDNAFARIAAGANDRQRHGAYIGGVTTMVDQQKISNQLLAQIAAGIRAARTAPLGRVNFGGRP